MSSGSHDSSFEQLDLFSGAGMSPSAPDLDTLDWAPLVPSGLSDAGLIAAIPRASQRDAPGLTQEAVRRRLTNAVPALEALCRRFSGFGLDREVTEQVAALRALASLGDAGAVTRLIVSPSVRGPSRRAALEAAAELGCRLPPDLIAAFLRDDDPKVREATCHCARGGANVIAALLDLLSDLHPTVTHAAALALGRLGRPEARAILTRLLQTEPSAAVIAALGQIANEDDFVRLGQTAIKRPDLASLVLEALDDTEQPRAAAVATGVRRGLGLAPSPPDHQGPNHDR